MTPHRISAVAALPLGVPLEGGTYQGILTQRDGTHVAVVLLPDLPRSRLSHPQAVVWAESVGGVLPSRPAAALLYATAKAQFDADWYWTSEPHEDDASYVWECSFSYGRVFTSHKSFQGRARAVRLIPLEAA